MISLLSPITWLAGFAVICGIFLGGYFKGRADEGVSWKIEKHGYEVAAGQAARREKETSDRWIKAVKLSGERYRAALKTYDGVYNNQLARLHKSAADAERLREASGAGSGDSETSGPSAAELLRAGEELIELARDADKDRAALIACTQGWPK